jgi:transposase
VKDAGAGEGLERASTAAEKAVVERPNSKDLHAKIGQQALEIDFLAGALGHVDDTSVKR